MSEKIVNYFQRVLSGKIEKRDWLITLILFSSIFTLSYWKGGPVGGFTFILAVATIWNIRITQGLLKQSKEAVEQSRLLAELTKEYTEITKELLNQSKETVRQSKISFLGNIIHGTIEYVEKLPEHNKAAEETRHVLSKAEAFKTLSAEVYRGFLEAMFNYRIGNIKQIKEKLEEAEKEAKKEGDSWASALDWVKKQD